MAGSGESSVEFRLLMAYAQRRRPPNTQSQPGGNAPPQSPRARDRRKKKKTSKKLRKMLLMCVHPQREKDEQPMGEIVDVTSVADRLSSIVDSVDIRLEDIETDSPNDVAQQIVELLRESGDQLDRKIKEDRVLAQHFRSGFTYALFERIATMFLQEVAPSDTIPDTQSPHQARIALTCEVTRKLDAVDRHPMNMVMGFGAKYLQENFSLWVLQRGGWENAFEDKEDNEVE
ncbi:hypothetical protein SKAU_G00046090 [Synaphobranchus kaupii]|uniref:Apoptosis facilitator Bcl-2-like protein 14 n=1 Tax=Synaphobranchus kaupii TaxID=118154 RepID=A0A9Q1G240_SYNKA|nr:hypothetical protein SKAU_G00046090 [Synaphobranchus kaupii]